MTPRVAVIDYGMGNLFSVCRALEESGAQAELVRSQDEIASAERVVLPGVGAFKDGMCGLRERDLVHAIQDYAATGRPLLGICLGMQMLLDTSEEFGHYKGLELIAGSVVAIPPVGVDGKRHKIPHIGWNALQVPGERSNGWSDSILQGIDPGNSVYFVHSFNVQPAHPSNRLADCHYGGVRISAAVQSGSIYGCQFHPEKSGPRGLQIIRNFLSL
jgi:glutamine amidotransferase